MSKTNEIERIKARIKSEKAKQLPDRELIASLEAKKALLSNDKTVKK